MVIIGITGRIGSGKSVIRNWFQNQGAVVIDVDQVAHRYLEPDQETYQEVIQAFGEGILDSDGQINRSRLGNLVFQSPDQLERLNRIIHPPLLQWLRDQFEQFRSVGGEKVLVIDAALLFQWDFGARLRSGDLGGCPEGDQEREDLGVTAVNR